MNEITTSAERGATTAEAEPRLRLSELQSLLRDAAALERARRPIVLHAAAAPAHPGVDVRVQSPAEVVGIAPWAPLRHPESQPRAWGVLLAYAGMGAATLGAAGAAVTDGNGVAVGFVGAGLLALLAGIARAVTEQNRGQ